MAWDTGTRQHSRTCGGIKAEGGWGVVCTEQVEIHHTSDITPFIELRLWDDRDVPMLARMAEKIHEHGALAGIELAYNGLNGPNLYGREVPMAPTGFPVASFTYDPVQARTMDKEDIRNLRRWHRAAARRGREAGFDLVYVYAGHALGFFHHFLSRRYNHRTDEYGGSLENRVRILKEVLTDTRDEVGDTCAVPCRFSVDEFAGPDGIDRAEAEDMIGLVAEIPDLWDICLAGWENDSKTSRFGPEGEQEFLYENMKSLTTKPVVGVGRYTSPDRMASLVRKGVLDLIGCARPSIADPFLPHKVETGQTDDIRECIGCNICVSGDFTMSPIRCTQNPSMGEEWRRGWHPRTLSTCPKREAGPDCRGRSCGTRGDSGAGKTWIRCRSCRKDDRCRGRVSREAGLPGLAQWRRVRDYREGQIRKLPNVSMYLDSELSADHLLEFGSPRVVIATGSSWRRDGVAHHWTRPVPVSQAMELLTPDDIMSGSLPGGSRVIIWDDDHYYMGGVIAELLTDKGYAVALMTPAAEVSTWTRNTMEQHFIQARLLDKGTEVIPHRVIDEIVGDGVVASCVFTGVSRPFAADSVVLVTSRLPNDGLYRELVARRDEWGAAGIESVRCIGDADAPATIAHAVFAGRRYAEELDEPTGPGDAVSFKREITELVVC